MKLLAAQPATPLDVEEFERRHGIVLPEGYRAFLLRFNGSMPSNGMFEAAGSTTTAYVELFCSITGNSDESGSVEYLLETKFPGVVTMGLLPLALAGGGDQLFLSLRTGAIYYWSWTTAPDGGFGENDLERLADSIEDLVAGLGGKEESVAHG